MTDAAVLDPQVLGEIDALENFQPGARAEVIRLFFESLTRDLSRARAAKAREDAVELRAALHSIKGCALGIGARALAQFAATLEAEVRAGAAPASIGVDALHAACDRAGDALRAWASEDGGASA